MLGVAHGWGNVPDNSDTLETPCRDVGEPLLPSTSAPDAYRHQPSYSPLGLLPIEPRHHTLPAPSIAAIGTHHFVKGGIRHPMRTYQHAEALRTHWVQGFQRHSRMEDIGLVAAIPTRVR
jgi:hypothetical protein